jgi:hypothetical protein
VIETSDPFDALAKVLPGAQAAFSKVTKDAANPHFQSRYASLSEIVDATVPVLNRAGVTVLQPVTVAGDGVQVTTVLLHESGQWLRATHTVPVTKRDAQGVGSALTYARRQALQALLTVAPMGEDDDAEGAVGRGAGRPPLPPAAPPAKPPRAARVGRLEKTLGEVRNRRDLDRAWDLSKELRAELEAQEPETAGRLAKLFADRSAELLEGSGTVPSPGGEA